MTYVPHPVFEVLGRRDVHEFFCASNNNIAHGNTAYHPEYKNIRFAELASRSQRPREVVDFDQINRVFHAKCEVAGLLLQCSVIKHGSLLTENAILPTSLKGQGHQRSISGLRGHLVSQKPLGRLIRNFH